MLRITVEIVPFGVEEDKKTIGEMVIVNDGAGTRNLGSYYWNLKDDKGLALFGEEVQHKRSHGVWPLIYKCLRQADGIRDA